MKIVGANGIATHGEGNIDLLLRRLKLMGHDVVDVRLPKRHFISARWGGCPDGSLLAQHSSDGDIIVAHSFGCLRAWHAHKVRNYRAIICIAPAMERASEWSHPDRVHCWYSPDDWAVRIGSWLRLHPFGRAGNKGFNQPGIKHTKVNGAGHGDFFVGDCFRRLAEYVHQVATDEVGNV